MTVTRMVRLAVFSLSLIFAGARPLAASPIQWTVGSGGNGNFYEGVAVVGGIDWDSARLAAIAMGGHLATITSSQENQFVFGLISGNSSVWRSSGCCNTYWGPYIGGYWDFSASAWAWVTGESFVFTNWDNWQSAPGAEPYVHFHGSNGQFEAKWNDLYSNLTTNGFVVEYETAPSVPEPSALVLLGTGLAVLVQRIRSGRRSA